MCWNARHGWRCRAAIRSPQRWRAGRASAAPYPGAVEEPGQGVRADHRRQGSAPRQRQFLRHADRRTVEPPRATRGILHHASPMAARPRRSPIRQALRPDAVAVTEGAARARPRSHRALRRPAGRRRAGGARNSAFKIGAAGLTPAEKIAAIEAYEIAGPPRADGRRWIKRRAGACRRARLVVADHRRPSHSGACRCAVPRRTAQAGAARRGRLAQGACADEAKSRARRDLQRARGAAGDCRRGHAADRGGCHVGLLAARHAQRVARAIPRGARLMNVLMYLVPMALLLGLTGLVAFLWSLKSGQYDDLDGAAVRILPDDDIKD